MTVNGLPLPRDRAEPHLLSYAPPAVATARTRIDSLDLLRGAAILGIFLMNTQSMGLVSAAYLNPTAHLTARDADGLLAFVGLDRWVWIVVHILADMKFITLFSLMFGAGILLQGDRVAARGQSPWAVHYRRMAVLLLLGALHGYLLWYGDILFSYAVCGILLFPLRKLPPPLLVPLGLLFIALPTVFEYLSREIYPIWNVYFQQAVNWMYTGTGSEIESYRNGGLAEFHYRAAESFFSQSLGLFTWTFWRCGGTMLIGFALQRWKFFAGEWSLPAYAFIALTLIPIGWAATILGVYHNDQIDWNWDLGIDFLPLQFNYVGSLLSCLGYAATGVLVASWVARRPRGLAALAVGPIRAVGRTALSNYLFQSLVGTTIFYGHGFGMFEKFSRPQLLLIVLPTWLVQLTVSPIYLRSFKQGPVEWCWHWLAYLGRNE